MQYCLAVFRSRTQVFEFTDILLSGGVNCKVVSTPADAHIGCGVCAKFPRINLPFAEDVINRYSLTSFKGFYIYEKTPYGVRTGRL